MLWQILEVIVSSAAAFVFIAMVADWINKRK